MMNRFVLVGLFVLVGCGGAEEETLFGASTATSEGNGGAGSGGGSGTGGDGAATSSSGMGGEGGGGGGTTSSSVSTGCNPKTCLTLAIELGGTDACGVLEDGCGNFVDCAGCDDPNHSCGGAPPTPQGETVDGTQSLCGGGCTDVTEQFGGCSVAHPIRMYCTASTSIGPFVGCESAGQLPTNIWCCP